MRSAGQQPPYASRRRFLALSGVGIAGSLAGRLVAGLWWGLRREALSALLPVLSDRVESALTAFATLALLTVVFPPTGGEEPT